MELGEHSNVIQIYDEFNTLVDSLGLYKSSGSGGSSYARSIFNSIYNGFSFLTFRFNVANFSFKS
jgi:hypothetical protein